MCRRWKACGKELYRQFVVVYTVRCLGRGAINAMVYPRVLLPWNWRASGYCYSFQHPTLQGCCRSVVLQAGE